MLTFIPPAFQVFILPLLYAEQNTALAEDVDCLHSLSEILISSSVGLIFRPWYSSNCFMNKLRGNFNLCSYAKFVLRIE